ncbi:hypothetical protein B484DRAFT_449689 [Ochromonadaceae sp. CCMP2298]|nr:hypothetical protein B484DRAFT_449689 [Ochromonadaceae sp. CCMP2298]|mmetsp:Transcript_32127/g.70792  ORF Transcript_32127/g.70792 Transcript_32127/m.70792 type:complete len:221 (-) Transcript_32127:200-862(-)
MELDSLPSFFFWAALWVCCLVIPPGSTEIVSSYRLNFLHGLISSVVAVCCMFDLVGDRFATMCTISYFCVDFLNILLNDFYFHAKSYQTPSGRKAEYFHHIFCFSSALYCELHWKQYCSLDKNPFVLFMLAELSTPFLIAWRYYPTNLMGAIFAVVFFAVRIVYHGCYLIPEYMRRCDAYRAFMVFALLYNGMNAFFMVMIVGKLVKKMRGKTLMEEKLA